MTSGLALAVLLGAAALVAIARYLASRRTHGSAPLVLVALQVPIAALLWFALSEPPEPARHALVVLTADATFPQDAAPEHAVALPEARPDARIERVPDLATALRRHPGATGLRILGAGLIARDRDAARGLPLELESPSEPSGLVEVDAPGTVVAGRRFSISGRVAGVDAVRAELRDPGDRVVATAVPDEDGRFVLDATAGPEGIARWRVRVLGEDDAERDAADVPIAVIATPALRVGIAAGSVSPELKYLRRALQDAGHSVASRLALGGGVEVADAALALDAASLAALDVLVLDERAWRALAAAQRAAIEAAVREGLGLVLRATGPLDDAVRRDWRALGLAIEADPDTSASFALERGGDVTAALTTLPWRVADRDTSSIELAGRRIGAWRPLGLGRIAFWRLADSHRLVTTGDAARHGETWAAALETLARARGARTPRVLDPAQVGERVVICGLDAAYAVVAPDGTRTALVPDRDADDCAGYWPQGPGLHVVAADVAQDPATATPFVVRAPHTSPSLARSELAAATQALERSHAAEPQQGPRARPPYLRAYALLAAFALLVLCWLLERRALRRA